MIKLYDSHAHISFPEYDNDRDAVIKRAVEAGFEFIINIGSGLGMKGNSDALRLAHQHDFIYTTVGLHPHEASLFSEQTLSDIAVMSDDPKVVAIGEVGLDYHYMHSPKDAQIQAFESFIKLARDKRLPLVIHSRDANKEVMSMLKRQRAGDVGGVIHSFGGDMEQAGKALELGFYLSINGIITFKNASALRDAVSKLPVDSLLIETDCPFLTPEPYRGKRNEPAYTAYVLKAISGIKGMDQAELSELLLENARQAFGIGVKQTIAYSFENRLYLNITNRCTNACTFCPKFRNDYYVKDYQLKLMKTEPSLEEIIKEIGDPSVYEEVVFVGYGEPTQRLDIVIAVSRWLREHGAKRIRLDTDGLANLLYGRDVTKELSQHLDAVSVSLNAPDAGAYAKLCPNPYGEASYHAVTEFIKHAKKNFKNVVATMVNLPNIDIEKTQAVAEELGVKLRVRQYYKESLRYKSD